MSASALLSIAGGGSRGVIPVAYLIYIQKEFKVDVKNLFRFHAGTSVGSILALGLAMPGDKTIYDIKTSLLDSLPKVFYNPPWYEKLLTLGFALRSEYNAAPLQAALQSQFGDTPFSAATKPVLIMATKTKPFSDYRFISDVQNPFPNLTMTQVIRASSAASTYLPAYFIKNNTGASIEFVDGGLSGANDPTMVAANYFDSRGHALKSILTLETGQVPLNLPVSSAKWGYLQYVAGSNEPLISGLFDTMVSNTTNMTADWGKINGRRVLNLNPLIPLKDDALNNGSPEVLDALMDIAQHDAENQKDAIGDFVRGLRP